MDVLINTQTCSGPYLKVREQKKYISIIYLIVPIINTLIFMWSVFVIL